MRQNKKKQRLVVVVEKWERLRTSFANIKSCQKRALWLDSSVSSSYIKIPLSGHQPRVTFREGRAQKSFQIKRE